eukprot:gb/GECH01012011.1/.p1 GENE.gb/GECH01012011.1/~~gb/GECH01012011.1/.p1  ORF type:complete len:476 (+),score=113.21 gb/GECH01012011.1/:1-1428(+)
MAKEIDNKSLEKFVYNVWDESIVDTMSRFIEIPNMSPNYDSEWNSNGYQEKASKLLMDWVKNQNVPGLKMDYIKEDDKTPVIFIEVDGDTDAGTALLYGHLDKQPPFDGWDEDLGPWKPVYRDGKLYGRGGADDGYAICGAITAIKALKEQGIPHSRCVILIEGCEESGSADLPHYIDKLKDQIGSPNLVVCLDSGAANYDQLWVTTSLRGVLIGNLNVQIISEGVHSGDASGVVPDTFRIARHVLSRLEDPETGDVVSDLQVDIPEDRQRQAGIAASFIKDEIYTKFPFCDGSQPRHKDPKELILDRSWRPALSIVGADGLPPTSSAGNVLRPSTNLKLSLRLSPTCDPEKAAAIVKDKLERDPPYNAKVSFDVVGHGAGWNAPSMSNWLEQAIVDSSKNYFGADACFMGEGGSIPFMGMLGQKFPKAEFLITGLLGPKSNAHGPNEFLHVPCGKKVTCCVSHVLAQHARNASK